MGTAADFLGLSPPPSAGTRPADVVPCQPKRLLIWDLNGGEGFPGDYDEMIGVYERAGIRADLAGTDWTGEIDDYAAIVWLTATSDPPWLTRVTGGSWRGNLLISAEWSPAWDATIAYVNGLTPFTGITVQHLLSKDAICPEEFAAAVPRPAKPKDPFIGGSLTAGLFSSFPPLVGKLLYIARVCSAIYQDNLKETIKPGYNLRRISGAIPPGIFAFDIAGETVVVVPGTTNAEQTVNQYGGWVVPAAWGPGGKINAEHLDLGNQIYPTLPVNTSLIIGHSLGGAIALQLAARAKSDGRPIVGAVGIGAPRSFNLAAVNATAWPSWINVVHAFDPVPLIAPDGIGLQSWRMPAEQWQIDPYADLDRTDVLPSSTTDLLAILAAIDSEWHWSTKYVDSLNLATLPRPEDPYAERQPQLKIVLSTAVEGGTPIYSAAFTTLPGEPRFWIMARTKIGLTNWIVAGDSSEFGGFDCPGPATYNTDFLLNLYSVYLQ